MILIPLEKYNSLVNNKDYTKPDYLKPKSVEPVCEVIDDDGDDMSDCQSYYLLMRLFNPYQKHIRIEVLHWLNFYNSVSVWRGMRTVSFQQKSLARFTFRTSAN